MWQNVAVRLLPCCSRRSALLACACAPCRLSPPRVIGTVSLSEFFVTLAAVLGFLLVLGPTHAASGAMRLDLALMLLVGGLLAAPIAPHLVQGVEPRRLGICVGAFICLTNVRVLL